MELDRAYWGSERIRENADADFIKEKSQAFCLRPKVGLVLTQCGALLANCPVGKFS